MKVLFWISSIIVLISEFFFLQGFINVYFKNYNGGPKSSSGSIIYYLIFGLVILIAGFFFYFTGSPRIAAAIMGIPVALALLYLFVTMILPLLMGGRMN